MKYLYLVLIICFLNIESKAQIYGNTIGSDDVFFQANYIVAYKIETGPSDSGLFTHLAVADRLGGNCAIKMAIYDHNATSNKPGTLLTDEYIASPTDGNINQYVLTNQPTLSASTFYWICIRTNCSYNSYRDNSTPWPLPPSHYLSINFNNAWPTTYNGSLNYVDSRSHVIFAVGNDQVLPVEMLSFDVDLEGNKPHLKWKVASEINNDGWYIQRSVNGFTWETIDWVEGNGNSSDERAYQYIDESSIFNRVFYRLEQKDYDGTVAHSEVKSLYIEPIGIIIYPNPTSDYIEIKGSEVGIQYLIINAMGEKVLEGKFGDQSKKIIVSHLQSGTYYINLIDINYKNSFVKN